MRGERARPPSRSPSDTAGGTRTCSERALWPQRLANMMDRMPVPMVPVPMVQCPSPYKPAVPT